MFSPEAGFDDAAIYKHNDNNIVFRRNKDGSVLLTQLNNDNKFYKINGIAAELWVALDGTKTLGAIMQNILESYDVDPATLSKDVETCMKELIQLEFVTK